MEDQKVVENHLTSAAAFVEGGIQDACDDACSICLEPFCDSDPSTVTNCKHEFHLQCILEWCQRSSQCPMCWQPISLKDPSSQELLDAVEHERNIRINPPRNRTIFHHPTLGDFELQHLPVNASESELEERIIQHLAAAAAMGRARHVSRRGGHRNRSSSAAQGRPQFLVFSTNPSDSSSQALGDSSNTVVSDVGSSPPEVGEDSPQIITHPPSYDVQIQTDQIVTNVSGSSAGASSNRAPSETSPNNQDRAGPSDFHSFSENFKSRLNALSTRYKDSIAKSTRSWKEKFFNRSSSSPEPTSDVNREPNQSANTGHNSVNASTGQIIGEVSRMMDHLNIAEDDRIRTINASSPLNTTEDGEIPNPSETERENLSSEDGARVPCSAGSTSS